MFYIGLLYRNVMLYRPGYKAMLYRPGYKGLDSIELGKKPRYRVYYILIVYKANNAILRSGV